nr:Chain E, peptide1 [Homo sapiens]4TUJ_F Chain F, peptide1 [Homo sapiens]
RCNPNMEPPRCWAAEGD